MSDIAKSGFKTEDEIVKEFNSWKETEEKNKQVKNWIKKMGISDPKIVSARLTRGHVEGNSKADIIVDIDGKKYGISVKKYTEQQQDYNQVDKRKVDNYDKMWHFPTDVKSILKQFCGVVGFRPSDTHDDTRDPRRYFLTELDKDAQDKVLKFFDENKDLIVINILKGDREPYADFILVVEKSQQNDIKRTNIVPIDQVLDHYTGQVEITKRGSLKIGKITVQRKGGNGGGLGAQMLQFKLSPSEMMDV